MSQFEILEIFFEILSIEILFSKFWIRDFDIWDFYFWDQPKPKNLKFRWLIVLSSMRILLYKNTMVLPQIKKIQQKLKKFWKKPKENFWIAPKYIIFYYTCYDVVIY